MELEPEPGREPGMELELKASDRYGNGADSHSGVLSGLRTAAIPAARRRSPAEIGFRARLVGHWFRWCNPLADPRAIIVMPGILTETVPYRETAIGS